MQATYNGTTWTTYSNYCRTTYSKYCRTLYSKYHMRSIIHHTTTWLAANRARVKLHPPNHNEYHQPRVMPAQKCRADSSQFNADRLRVPEYWKPTQNTYGCNVLSLAAGSCLSWELTCTQLLTLIRDTRCERRCWVTRRQSIIPQLSNMLKTGYRRKKHCSLTSAC